MSSNFFTQTFQNLFEVDSGKSWQDRWRQSRGEAFDPVLLDRGDGGLLRVGKLDHGNAANQHEEGKPLRLKTIEQLCAGGSRASNTRATTPGPGFNPFSSSVITPNSGDIKIKVFNGNKSCSKAGII